MSVDSSVGAGSAPGAESRVGVGLGVGGGSPVGGGLPVGGELPVGEGLPVGDGWSADDGLPAGLHVGVDVASWAKLVTDIEDHCVYAWPPTFVERPDDGWILRATPGLPGRGRSNHALPPVRTLGQAELTAGIRQAQEFAARQGIECGLQIGPTSIHQPLLAEVAERGWTIRQAVKVMTVDTRAVAAEADPAFDLTIDDNATPAWLSAWEHCDGRTDVEAHVNTVFPRMAGIAHFAHSANRAVGISVQHHGIVGLFCLAVSPECRRQGLGKALVRSMLSAHDAPLTYLQVFSENAAGLGLYRSLGFQEAYRYRHALAPADR